MVRLIMIVILMGLLTACSINGLGPPGYLVQKAIAFQLQQTQQQLSQQVDLDFQGFDIYHLSITKQQPLIIQDLPTYRIRGTYDLIFKIPGRQVTQQKHPFEVYLQRQKEGKTWRIILPQYTGKDKQQTWRSYLLP